MRYKIAALFAAALMLAGLSAAPAAAGTPVANPDTACRVTTNLGFTSHGLATLDGNTVWAVWQPAATKPANNCNGVAIKNWQDHYQGKNTVVWAVIYPNYPSSTGSYQVQTGAGIVQGTTFWTSLGFVGDGKIYRIFAVDQYAGGNPATPTGTRED
jgi:hypothetical protein